MVSPIVPTQPAPAISSLGALIAASAAGVLAGDAAARAARADAAAASLSTSRDELTIGPIDGDPRASADRDADGRETFGDGAGDAGREETDQGEPARRAAPLPGDDRGGSLDVMV